MDTVTRILAKSGLPASTLPFATGLAVGGLLIQFATRNGWGRRQPVPKQRKGMSYNLDKELVEVLIPRTPALAVPLVKIYARPGGHRIDWADVTTPHVC